MNLLLQFCVLVLLLGSVPPCSAAPSLVDHYRKALDVDPHNQTLRYHLGIALLNLGENRLAVKEFQAAYPQRADDPEINYNLALAFMRLNDPDSALLYLEQALANGAGGQPEIYPLQNVYFNLVLVYEQLGQLDAALQLLQRLSDENPAYLDYLRLLGDYQLRLGQVENAMHSFFKYLQQMPDDSEVRDYAFASIFNRGLAAYEHQDFSGARQEFLRAIEFDAERPLALYYLALLDYQQENYQSVAERLPSLYERLTPDQKESARSILYNSALSLKRLKEFKPALKALQPLIRVENPLIKDLALLAAIQLESGAYGLAHQSYLQVLQKNPGHGTAALGVQAAERGAFEELMLEVGEAFAAEDLLLVRKYLELAAEIYPKDNRLRIYQARLTRAAKENWTGLLQRSETLEGQQEYVAALALLREGLNLSPSEPQLLDQEKRLVSFLAERIDGLFTQGEELYAQSELTLARQRFTQLKLLSPGHQEGIDFLHKIESELQQEAQRAVGAGEAALNGAELLDARRNFQRALVAWPEENAAKTGLARVEEMLRERVAETLVHARRARVAGQLQAAAEILEEGLQRSPAAVLDSALARVKGELSQRQDAIARLVRVAISQQQFSKAAQFLVQAGRLDSGSVGFAELTAELDTAREIEVRRQLDRAREEVIVGSFDSGLQAYRRALDIDPDNAEALAGLKRGRSELSWTIKRALDEGSIAHQAGNVERARQAYRRVVSLDPHQADALKALRQIDRAARAGLSSVDTKRLYLEGIELYTEGAYNKAIATWRLVLDLDPTHKKAKLNIDKAERKLNLIKERKHG